jgi:hypothetical protein
LSSFGAARDQGIDDGVAAFKAGQPNSPTCPYENIIQCGIYNDAFHKGWNDAQEVAP